MYLNNKLQINDIFRQFSLWSQLTNFVSKLKHEQKMYLNKIEGYTPTPWLTLLLVLGKTRVKQNSS